VKKLESIDDVQSQNAGANMGTARGQDVLDKSIGLHGLGRGIVVDKNGIVIAGDKILESAKRLGVKKIRVVRTTGDSLVAVRRTDLDLEKDVAAKELAVLDNRAAELNLFWDQSMLDTVAGEFGLDLKSIGFEGSVGLGQSAKSLPAGFGGNKPPQGATLSIGRVYVMTVPHDTFTAWQRSLNDSVGFDDDAIEEELKKRLKI
jgi:hypothetical protein